MPTGLKIPTAPMIGDAEQRELLVSELSKNVMVDASAGSGKTQSLSQRMAEGLLSGLYEPKKMAAVTFTRKAAAELRGRLQLVLEKALRLETDPTRRSRAAFGLQQLEQIFVGTIHSFCSQLLREFPVEAGLSPGFRELDPLAKEQMLAQVYRRVLAEASETMPGTLGALSEGEVGRTDLLSGLATVCEHQEVDFLIPMVERPDPGKMWPELEWFAAQMKRRLPERADPSATCTLQRASYRFLERLPQADRLSMHSLLNLLKDWSKPLKLTQKNWPGDSTKERKQNALEALGMAEEFVAQTVQPFLGQWRDYLYAHCQQLFEVTRTMFEQERRRKSQLDYGDLLHQAARLLRQNPRVREILKSKYRWLLVDEFQDTDPIQAEIILLLACADRYQGEDWTRCPLRPGALFIVGDPKQSIYRFRRADIGIYNFVKQRIKDSGGLLLSLTTSFRSVPQLCTWTNSVFGSLFPSESSPLQAAFSGLQPVRSEAQAAWAGVYVLTDHSEKKQWNGVAAQEAQRIAGLIFEAVERGDYQWGDFLILTTRKAEVSHYAAALEQRAIPTESSGGGACEGSYWLNVLKAMLRALVDPHDAVETIGVLRGPLFGLSDQDLFLHSQAGGSFDLLKAHEASPGHPSVTGALSTLGSLHRVSRQLPAGACVERIIEESGLLVVATCSDPGDGEVPALLQFADQLRAATLEGRTLAQAIRDVELITAERAVSLRAGRTNVVRVMNLHQAKGLQAPVVFLAAPTNGMSPRAETRIVRQDGVARGYLALKKSNPFKGQGELFAAPLDWEQHEAAELESLQAEQLRLLYVAATRARDVLVVGRWANNHGSARLAWAPFEPFLSQVQELPWLQPASETPTATTKVVIEDANEATLNRAAGWAHCARPSWSRTSVTAQQDKEKIQFQAEPIPHQVWEGERLDAGPAWGDLVHRLLEHAMRHPHQDREQLTRLAHWFVLEQPELGDLVPLAVDSVLEVMDTPFWRDALKEEQRLLEVPFGVRSEDGRTLLFGVLDLVMGSSQAWQIVDYKTDLSPMDRLLQKYAGQIVSYAKNWVKLSKQDVSYAGVFRTRSQELSRDLRIPPELGQQSTDSFGGIRPYIP